MMETDFANLSLDIVRVSNYISFAFIFLFISTLSFILFRLWHNENFLLSFNSDAPSKSKKRQRLDVTSVTFPCSLTIDSNVSNLVDGCHIKIFGNGDINIWAYWGVKTSDLFESLNQPYSFWICKLYDNSLHKCMAFTESISINNIGDDSQVGGQKLHLKSPIDINFQLLGTAPRSYYPLIIYCAVNEAKKHQMTLRKRNNKSIENLETQHPKTVLVTLIHLSDPLSPQPSAILAQYFKNDCGKIYALQPLYMATDNTSTCAELPEQTDKDEPISSTLKDFENNTSSGLCIICNEAVSDHVILPCRHVCTCKNCFPKLDKCPMCRGPLLSYWIISN